MLQKNAFGQKNFEFHAQVQKCHFGNFSILPFWPKAFFCSIMKMGIRKDIHNLSQGPQNPGVMQEKVQKGDFLKKDLRELFFFLF